MISLNSHEFPENLKPDDTIQVMGSGKTIEK